MYNVIRCVVSPLCTSLILCHPAVYFIFFYLIPNWALSLNRGLVGFVLNLKCIIFVQNLFMRSMKKVLLMAGVAVLCLTSCKTMDMSRMISAVEKGSQAMTLSNSEVQAYVKQAVAQMDKQNQIAPANSAYTQRLNKLTANLRSVDGTPLNFKVYITKDINAFACADGSVRVYSGIMDMMTDDELLGIIGHEIGHVANQDSKDAMKQAILNSAMIDAVGSVGTGTAALTDGVLGQLAQSLMSAKYSRKQESEADDFGYDFLKASGRNPYAMVLAFEKMQKLEGGNSKVTGSLANAFSDHPDTAQRIKNMQARCAKDGFTRPSK